VSVRVPDVKNYGLTQSGTGCFIVAHMTTVGVKGSTEIWMYRGNP